jgi:hypothetical protein
MQLLNVTFQVIQSDFTNTNFDVTFEPASFDSFDPAVPVEEGTLQPVLHLTGIAASGFYSCVFSPNISTATSNCPRFSSGSNLEKLLNYNRGYTLRVSTVLPDESTNQATVADLVLRGSNPLQTYNLVQPYVSVNWFFGTIGFRYNATSFFADVLGNISFSYTLVKGVTVYNVLYVPKLSPLTTAALPLLGISDTDWRVNGDNTFNIGDGDYNVTNAILIYDSGFGSFEFPLAEGQAEAGTQIFVYSFTGDPIIDSPLNGYRWDPAQPLDVVYTIPNDRPIYIELTIYIFNSNGQTTALLIYLDHTSYVTEATCRISYDSQTQRLNPVNGACATSFSTGNTFDVANVDSFQVFLRYHDIRQILKSDTSPPSFYYDVSTGPVAIAVAHSQGGCTTFTLQSQEALLNNTATLEIASQNEQANVYTVTFGHPLFGTANTEANVTLCWGLNFTGQLQSLEVPFTSSISSCVPPDTYQVTFSGQDLQGHAAATDDLGTSFLEITSQQGCNYPNAPTSDLSACLPEGNICSKNENLHQATQLMQGESRLEGDSLVLKWSSSAQYHTFSVVFEGAANSTYCNYVSCLTDNPVYALTGSTCDLELTGTYDATDAIVNCFKTVESNDPNFVYYRANINTQSVQHVTIQRPNGDTIPINRTIVDNSTLTLAFPTNVNITLLNPIVTQGPAGFAATLLSKNFEIATQTMRLVVATTIQWPYKVVVTSSSATNGFSIEGSVNVSTASCSSSSPICYQYFTFDVTPDDPSNCIVDTEVTLQFGVTCQSSFTGNCQSGQTAQITVDLQSTDYCSRIIDDATFAANLDSYSDSALSSPQSDFTYNSVLYMLLRVNPEYREIISYLTLDSITVGDSGVDRSYTSFNNFLIINDGPGRSGFSNELDFSLTLDENSIPTTVNSVSDSQKTVDITAFATVHYVSVLNNQPASRKIKLQAVEVKPQNQFKSQAIVNKFSVTSSISLFDVGDLPGDTGGNSTGIRFTFKERGKHEVASSVAVLSVTGLIGLVMFIVSLWKITLSVEMV